MLLLLYLLSVLSVVVMVLCALPGVRGIGVYDVVVVLLLLLSVSLFLVVAGGGVMALLYYSLCLPVLWLFISVMRVRLLAMSLFSPLLLLLVCGGWTCGLTLSLAVLRRIVVGKLVYARL